MKFIYAFIIIILDADIYNTMCLIYIIEGIYFSRSFCGIKCLIIPMLILSKFSFDCATISINYKYIFILQS